MNAQIMNGRALAKRFRAEAKAEVEWLKADGIAPFLAVINVGENPANRVYVNGKRRDSAKCGILFEEFALPEETPESEVLALVDKLNRRKDVHGILAQSPMPPLIDRRKVFDAIDPLKDVDSFHPVNAGYIMQGNYRLLPGTPAGIMALLDEYGVDPAGKECVMVGRSDIVGKPMALLLLHRHGTVTICHSRTPNLKEHCLRADILISSTAQIGLIRGDMVKPGAVVVDVSINHDADGNICGDVVFDEVAEKASLITPVPGGVGPITRAILMKNTVRAAKLQNGLTE